MSPEAVQAIVVLLALGMNIYTAMDARATPEDVFEAVGRSRRKWMTLSLVGAFLSLAGVVIAGYYIVKVRPALRAELKKRDQLILVSAWHKFVRYLLPALSLAVAAVIAQHSATH